MTYNANLKAKNERIRALIDKANALPDAGSEGGSDVLIIECLDPEGTLDGATATFTGTPSISLSDVKTSISEGSFAVLKLTLDGDALYLPLVSTGDDDSLYFATADNQGGTAVGEFVRHDDGTESITITITIKEGDGGSEEPDYRDLYQRVEYITSDGEAYVLTDFVADNTCGLEIIAAFPALHDRVPMGSRVDGNATRFYCVYPLSASSCYFGFNTGNSFSCALSVNTPYRLQTNFIDSRIACVFDINGIRKGSTNISATLVQQTCPVGIFGYNRTDTGISTKREYTLYSARCSSGHEIVREYIPCYRKSDGVVGLYEKFTGEFLTTPVGAFAKGQDVDW